MEQSEAGTAVITRFYLKHHSMMGETLKRLRQAAGMSQTDLAVELGLNSPAAISHYETGSRRLPLDVLERAAACAGYQMRMVFDAIGE